MINRRDFAAGLAVTAIATKVRAQTGGRSYRLAILNPTQLLGPTSPGGQLIVEALAGMGFVLNQNLTLVARTLMGDLAKIPAVLQELVAARVDALITFGYPSAAAVKLSGIPAVVLSAGDPVATGLAASISRPGGNVTGIFEDEEALSSKRLALLKETDPRIRKVAMLWNRDDLGMTLRYQASAKIARSLGLEVQSLGVREPDDFGTAFAEMDAAKPDGILMVTDVLTILNRSRVFEYAAARKIPAIYEVSAFARDRGLMSYGSDTNETLRRAAILAGRILKGETAANLPFEQASSYQLAVNLKTAAAIGLDIPLSVLARADEVIE